MATPLPFSLHRVHPDDVPALARISADSFKNDRATQMKALGKDPYDLEKYTLESLPSQLQDPRYITMKATADATGDILGWVSWGHRGYDFAPVRTKTEEPKEQEDMVGKKSAEEEEPVQDEDDPISRLHALTGGDMNRWMEKLMPPGTKCMYMMGISVAPAFHSRGVGSALMRQVTQRADADGVFCWVHSSEAGRHVFAKAGFEEVGRLEVDLDEYAPQPAPDRDGKWGRYTYRYMKRLPRHGRETTAEG